MDQGSVATKRITVGVDGSASSRRALRRAIEEAAATGATVVAVMAWNWPAALQWDLAELAGESPEALVAGRLDAILDPLRRQHPGVDIEAVVGEGHPVPVLVEASRDSDMLILGSRYGAAADEAVGSVSRPCQTHARCPVVVLHDG